MSEVSSAENQVTQPEYLGDAVYASFDGYHIWLHLNDHRSPGLIALEPSVMNALYEYAKRALGDPEADEHVPGAHT